MQDIPDPFIFRKAHKRAGYARLVHEYICTLHAGMCTLTLMCVSIYVYMNIYMCLYVTSRGGQEAIGYNETGNLANTQTTDT